MTEPNPRPLNSTMLRVWQFLPRINAAKNLIIVATTLLPITLPTIANANKITLPESPHRSLVYAKCRTCHDLQYVIESKGLTVDTWDGLLEDMEDLGVDLTPVERNNIFTYLSTYLSDQKPPAPPIKQESEIAARVDGRAIFMENCTSCHMKNAKGVKDTFPPLASNPDLFLAQDLPIKTLLNGMSGVIEVNGKKFEGDMPGFDHLSDNEISAVVNFIRSSFGNDAAAHPKIKPVTPKMVKKLRDTEIEPEQVLAYRSSLKK